MDILNHFNLLREELDNYYSGFDSAENKLLPALKEHLNSCSENSSYAKKSSMHEFLSKACPIKIFRNTPLFFEISSGRDRHSWGGLQSRVGTYLYSLSADLWLNPYFDNLKEDLNEGFIYCWNNPVGIDHHCAGYTNLLALGINGIIEKAEEKLNETEDKKKKEFYKSVIRSNKALINLAKRFSSEAKSLSENSNSPEEKEHYEKIASAAEWIPANPPRTFYEALNLILFYRECASSIEGIGISTFSLLDRLLYPYYKKDLEKGEINYIEAKKLLCDLLIYTDIRFESDKAYHETSTTIELGGFDRNGEVVYNELTEMILDAVIEVQSVGTKINCRISKSHPTEYFKKIMEVQLSNLPCVMMHNDDVLIPARVKLGEDIEDARSYVGCGCHEVVLADTEVCTRADTWINLPRILLKSLKDHQDAKTFEEFYDAFISDAFLYYSKIVGLKNKGEAHWCEYSPYPLYSSSLTGPIEKGLDVTEGGAKYNTTAISLLGTATFIDSLYSVKALVFDEKRLKISELSEILDKNFENNEDLRQYIINRIPKHGTNDKILNAFSAKVLRDMSKIAGQTNSRGGKYIPAFYAHDIHTPLGHRTKATPDGRLANTPLSRGVSPSEFIKTESPLKVIHSLKDIDFTLYGDSFICEITLPQMEKNEGNLTILVAIIKEFLEAGGSSLQFNLIDSKLLLEAKENPEQHKNLLVRVCGYSAAFVYLCEDTQDEIIRRAIR